MDSDADEGSQLLEARAEARPLPWGDLTREQQDAARKVCKLLNWLAKYSKEELTRREGVERAYSQIELQRHNRLILIDGGRGSGKTTVLLTLLELWKKGLGSKPDVPPDWRDLIPIPGRIVPLDIIDLASLPQSASLILHIAELLRRLMEVMEPLPKRADDGGDVVPWSPHAGVQRPSREGWDVFLRAAAVGWDGNLRQRQAHIDAETYVAELDLSERERHDVLSAFRRFAEALVKEFTGWGRIHSQFSDEPLLVVPIDDVDMNPDRVVELLQLTNLLRHSRVAFLITGNTGLFLAELKAHFAGALRAPARGVELTHARGSDLAWEELSQLGVLSEVAPLARRYYDKLIPPHHRCAIRPIELSKRASILTDGSDVEQTIQEASVRLRGIFRRQPRARLALPGQMRALLDLREWLQSEGTVNANERLAELAVRLWQQAVDEEDGLPSERRDEMYDFVSLMDETVRRLIEGAPLYLEKGSMSLYYEVVPLRKPAVSIPVPNGQLEAHFYIASLGTEPRGSLGYESEKGMSLRRETIAAWLFASQVSGTATGIVGPTGTLIDIAGIDLKTTSAPTTQLHIPWPVPIWPTESQRIEDLRSIWLKCLLDLEPQTADDSSATRYAQGFLGTIIEVIEGSPESEVTSRYDWAVIATGLVRLASEGTLEQERDWARFRAPLLAAPESGLGTDAAERLLGALKSAWQSSEWENLLPKLRTERESRVRQALPPSSNVPIEDWLSRIQTAWGDSHAWYRLVEQNETSVGKKAEAGPDLKPDEVGERRGRAGRSESPRRKNSPTRQKD